MKVLRTIWLKIRSHRQRAMVKREVDEELRFHVERRTAENIAADVWQSSLEEKPGGEIYLNFHQTGGLGEGHAVVALRYE